KVLSLKKNEETFTFQASERPVPSLLRGFSAPVILQYPYTEAELLHLMAKDDDAFNRWEAAQRLATTTILEKGGQPSPAFVAAARNVLADPEPVFAAEVLYLLAEIFLADLMDGVDPDRMYF